jgi:SAM-dependent methyltransferase
MRQHIVKDRSVGVDPAFSNDQYEDGYPTGIERSFWHVARNFTIFKWLRNFGMDKQRLLEVGCGRGIIVDYLLSKGIDCIGCDLAAPSVPAHLANKVFPATDFRSLPFATRREIKGVLLCDVIEHLEDSAELLQALPEFLPELTRVLITVPARRELWSEWDDHFGHARRYDLDMLRRELDVAGLDPVSSRYFFHTLYVPMYMARRHRRGTVKTPRAAWFQRMVGAALIFEQQLVPSQVPGTSIIGIADVSRSGSRATDFPAPRDISIGDNL